MPNQWFISFLELAKLFEMGYLQERRLIWLITMKFIANEDTNLWHNWLNCSMAIQGLHHQWNNMKQILIHCDYGELVCEKWLEFSFLSDLIE